MKNIGQLHIPYNNINEAKTLMYIVHCAVLFTPIERIINIGVVSREMNKIEYLLSAGLGIIWDRGKKSTAQIFRWWFGIVSSNGRFTPATAALLTVAMPDVAPGDGLTKYLLTMSFAPE